MNRSGARIFNFFHSMTALAIRGGRFVAEQRFRPCLGMAARTNLVIPEGGVVAVPLKFMAERAISPETSTRVQPRVRVDVLRMGKLEDDRALVLEAREWQQLLGACRRKNGVALDADFLFQVLVEVILVAGGALIVPGAL